MLFDLQGKRRRVVQGTYAMLAILMGGGLVLFGVGSSASGGLLDAFKGGNGADTSGNDLIQKRIDRNEKKLKVTPTSEPVLEALVRDHYNLAASKVGPNAQSFSGDARKELVLAGQSWEAYLKATKRPDPSLANTALQIYDPTALNKPKSGQQAALILARAQNSPEAYVKVVQWAALNKDTRTADLAAQKAEDLAPKSQRKQVRAAVKQAKAPPPTGAQGTSAGG
jgi:hypothetical protein